MPFQIIINDEAHLDLIDIAYFISSRSDPDTAERVVKHILGTYTKLSENPGLGVIRDFGRPHLRAMRMIPVSDCPNYLVFFKVEDDQLQVIRVLHGARNIERLISDSDT